MTDGTKEESCRSPHTVVKLWTCALCGGLCTTLYGDGNTRPILHQTLCNGGELVGYVEWSFVLQCFVFVSFLMGVEISSYRC